MKMMDNAAGVVCARWSRDHIVTIGIDAINFFAPLHNGQLVHCFARLIFTSSRAMEVLILAFADPTLLLPRLQLTLREASMKKPPTYTPIASPSKNPGVASRMDLICSAFYTFVCIDKSTGKSKHVAKFEPVTDMERMLYAEGKKRYELRKAERLRKKKLTASGLPPKHGAVYLSLCLPISLALARFPFSWCVVPAPSLAALPWSLGLLRFCN